jgi:single-strand DNA-binding protein
MTNKAILIGHLGQDPETGETQRGARFCSFSLATSRKWTDKASGEKKEKTQWHRVIVWGDGIANECGKRLRKGSKVYVEGEIEHRKYTDKMSIERWATEIVVQGFGGQVVFCDGGDRQPGAGVRDTPPPPDDPEGWRGSP